MRVALLNQFYPPDLSPTAHVAASLAEHRAAAGDTITVVTGRGGYAGGAARAEASAPPGLRVVRLWGPGLGRRSTLARLVDYLVFCAGALLRMVTLPRQDVVVTMTTPPFLAVAAMAHRALHRRTRVVLWSMDCYPDVAEVYGTIRKGGVASRALRALNRWLYRRLDHVVCLDGAMLERLRSQYAGDAQPPMTVIPNWESVERFADVPAPRARDGIEPFVVLYQGNLGYGHRFDTVVDAAARLAGTGVEVRFVGGGVRWADLAAEVDRRGLDDVTLHPYVDKDETPGLLAEAGAALITLDDDALGLMSPSKLHSALASGLPVLYVGPQGSNVDEAIRRFGCGVSLRHGDVDGLVDAVRTLQAGGPVAEGLRASARRAFEQAYSDAATLPRFDEVLAGSGGEARGAGIAR